MAANGVNVKMGVEGISQFKQNIKVAQTAVKTLDEQLKLNEKQFKATGDAEQYMQEKSELLKVKLEEQKAVVANAEKALDQMTKNGTDKASAAFQRMQQELLRAKGDMIDTETELNNISVAGEEAGNGVDAMNQQLKRVGDGVSWQNVTDGLEKISSSMSAVMQKAWKMGEALVKNVLGAGSWADELVTTATQYEDTLKTMSGGGSATEYLQRMRKTANLIDTEVDTILQAQNKLKKGREEKNKDTMGAFAYLGIDPARMNTADAFWKAGEAIAKLTEEEDKNHYAQALFGKSWRELLPLFKTGREEYEKTMDSWSVVSDDALDNLGKMDDQYQKLTGEWETFKNEMLSAFAGPLTEGMETLTGFVKELNEYLQTPEGKEMLQQMGDTITKLIEDLTSVNPEDVVNGLKGVVDGITVGLKWIAENRGVVVGAVEAFIGAWAAIKVSEGVATVLKLIDSIKGLSTGGIATAGSAAGASWASAFGTAAVAGLMLFPVLKRIFEGETPEEKEANEKVKQINALAEDMKKGGAKSASGRDALGALWNVATTGKTGHEVDQAILDQQEAESRNSRWMGSMHALDQLQNATEDLTGRTVQSTSEMTAAANDMKGLPAEVAAAVRDVVASMVIYIDGESVGRAVTPHVCGSMGSRLLATTK